MLKQPRIRLLLWISCLALVVGSFPAISVQGQSAPVWITIATSGMMGDSDMLRAPIAEFEASHPGIKVQVVTADDQIPSPANGLSAYFDALKAYVSAADVLFTSYELMTPLATQGHYLLDLNPLVSVDTSMNDFYPAAANAYRWDNGLWALPISGDALVLSYSPEAFDAAGIAYPSSKWTLEDFAIAARKLTQKSASGAVTRPAIFAPGPEARAALIQSLVGNSLIDTGSIPNTPIFSDEITRQVLQTLSDLDQEGVLASDLNAPMVLLQASLLSRLSSGGISFSSGGGGSDTSSTNTTPAKRSMVALPGGTAAVGLQTQGLAISAGSQHVNEAYELIRYFTQHGLSASGMPGFFGSPVRKSAPSSTKFSDEAQPFIDQALNSGITPADLRFSVYALNALDKMRQAASKKETLDARTALENAETQAIQDLKAAAQNQPTIQVAEPRIASVPTNKITLNFGITSFIRPMPYQDAWKRLAEEFAANDPEVGYVNLDTNGSQDLEQNANNYDCFTLPFNAVPGGKTSALFNLDPLMSVDKNFDKQDIFNSILAQVQQDGKTWAMPLMIEPTMLSYDSNQFKKANVPEPQGGWTVSDFNDALKALKATASQQPFVPRSPGGTYLLMLMAANGGLPIDYRTTPPTIDFTSPDVVAAIRNVLDQARDGLIKYSAVGTMQAIMMISASADQGPALTTYILLPFIKTAGDNPYKAVTFPTGTKYNAVSYNLNTAYISAKAKNPDACYRWISAIMQHPELFTAMPTRRSQIDSPAVKAVQGPDMIATYKKMGDLLDDSQTIVFPSLFQGGTAPVGFLVEHWLYEAFDNYVQKGTDLDMGLKQAQDYAKAFLTCMASLPADESTPSPDQTSGAFNTGYTDCAVKVDPRLKSVMK